MLKVYLQGHTQALFQGSCKRFLITDPELKNGGGYDPTGGEQDSVEAGF